MQETFDAFGSAISPEAEFAKLEAAAQQLVAGSKALAADARKLGAASSIGDIGQLKRAIQSTIRRADELAKAAAVVRSVNVDAIVSSIGSRRFYDDIVEVSKSLGLDGVRVSGRAVLSYPHRITVESPAGYRLGSRLVRQMRPRAIAKLLGGEREKTQAVSGPYLEALRSSYLRLSKGQIGISIALDEIYDLLTTLPGSKRNYSENDFVRDVGVLRELGPFVTKDGLRVSFPASTSARMNRGYISVNRAGDEVRLSSIRFDSAAFAI